MSHTATTINPQSMLVYELDGQAVLKFFSGGSLPAVTEIYLAADQADVLFMCLEAFLQDVGKCNSGVPN